VDASYAWAILAALFGLAAGFQGVYQRYDKESFSGATTLPGLLYLGSRAVIPAGVFTILLARETITENLWLWAMATGTSTEAVLRTRFFLKKDEKNPDQDVLWGPFDLVKWYQELALSSIGSRLSARNIKHVEQFLHLITSFDAFSQRTLARLNGLTSAAVRDELTTEITKLRADYTSSTAPERDAIFSTTLMYLLNRKLPRQEFDALISDK
jgi:hypothetical protein